MRICVSALLGIVRFGRQGKDGGREGRRECRECIFVYILIDRERLSLRREREKANVHNK